MKKFFNQLFSDSNTINEKSIVGFCSFVVMVAFACADIVTGTLGKDLIINEFVFNSFLILTLGSFGIGSIDKWLNKKHETEAQKEEAQKEEQIEPTYEEPIQ
jgi:hypothetical protein